jgi:hypothetical protein
MLVVACFDEVSMSTAEYTRKLDELDRLLNDPDVPMQPDRIWSLLADVSRPQVTVAAAAARSALAGSAMPGSGLAGSAEG